VGQPAHQAHTHHTAPHAHTHAATGPGRRQAASGKQQAAGGFGKLQAVRGVVRNRSGRLQQATGARSAGRAAVADPETNQEEG